MAVWTAGLGDCMCYIEKALICACSYNLYSWICLVLFGLQIYADACPEN